MIGPFVFARVITGRRRLKDDPTTRLVIINRNAQRNKTKIIMSNNYYPIQIINLELKITQ